MYHIFQRNDESCWCSVRIQDGTEYFESPNMEQATEDVILAADVLNGEKITAWHIDIERVVTLGKEHCIKVFGTHQDDGGKFHGKCARCGAELE